MNIYFLVNDERKIYRTVGDRPPGKRCLVCNSLTGERLQEFIQTSVQKKPPEIGRKCYS